MRIRFDYLLVVQVLIAFAGQIECQKNFTKKRVPRGSSNIPLDNLRVPPGSSNIPLDDLKRSFSSPYEY